MPSDSENLILHVDGDSFFVACEVSEHSEYKGKPVIDLEGKFLKYGVFGHRNLTSKRGAGDPGDYLLQALADAGYEEFDFAEGEDVRVWQSRQGELGIKPDGLPGSATVAALKEAGYVDGLWVAV